MCDGLRVACIVDKQVNFQCQMETNTQRLLPCPHGSTVRALLVAVVALFGLAWLNYQHALTDPLLPHSGQIATAKAWVKSKARDPRSVNFHDITAEDDDSNVIRLHFSRFDEPGVESWRRWRFNFDRETSLLQVVNDEDTGRVVAYGDAMLARIRATETEAVQASQAKIQADVHQALERVDALPALPGEIVTKPVSLPVVPGLGPGY